MPPCQLRHGTAPFRTIGKHRSRPVYADLKALEVGNWVLGERITFSPTIFPHYPFFAISSH